MRRSVAAPDGTTAASLVAGADRACAASLPPEAHSVAQVFVDRGRAHDAVEYRRRLASWSPRLAARSADGADAVAGTRRHQRGTGRLSTAGCKVPSVARADRLPLPGA